MDAREYRFAASAAPVNAAPTIGTFEASVSMTVTAVDTAETMALNPVSTTRTADSMRPKAETITVATVPAAMPASTAYNAKCCTPTMMALMSDCGVPPKADINASPMPTSAAFSSGDVATASSSSVSYTHLTLPTI